MEIKAELTDVSNVKLVWTIRRNEDTGYFALKDFLPILKQLNDADFQTEFKLDLKKLQGERNLVLDNQEVNLLLTKFGILIDSDIMGEKWITSDKATSILNKAGILKIFQSKLDALISTPLKRNQSSLQTSTLVSLDVDDHRDIGSPLKKIRFDITKELRAIPIFQHDIDHEYAEIPLRMHKAKFVKSLADAHQRIKIEALLQKLLFPNQTETTKNSISDRHVIDLHLDELNERFPNVPLNLNIPVDEHGNSPLHWLTSIANLELVKELIKTGSDRLLGDNNGESPLVKAIKSVNNYDSGTFEELLDYLYPCLILLDSMNRSILHHIVITSGVGGCAAAAKYYLDILMGWLVKKEARPVAVSVSDKKSDNHSKGDIILDQLNLNWLIKNMLNAQDSNGDTCLNIAARLGNVAIVEALLDYGSDAYIANKSGLRPVDFGVVRTKTTLQASRGTDQINLSINNSSLLNPTNHSTTDDSFYKVDFLREPDTSILFNNMKDMLEAVGRDYENEKIGLKEKLDLLYQKLYLEKNQLASAKDKLVNTKMMNDKLILIKEQLLNIEKGLAEENQKFFEESENLGISTEDSKTIDWDSGEFDADEPFRVDFIYKFLNEKLQNEYSGNIEKLLIEESVENVMKQVRSANGNHKIKSILPPAILLKARINAYKKNDQHLECTFKTLRDKQYNLEAKFRRVLSLCLKVDEEKVDGMLDGLLLAITTEDSQDIDPDEMQDFLNKHSIA